MASCSAGALLYRFHTSQIRELEVLLVHPSGNYNRTAPWSIPKGLPEKDETMEQAARRETAEEAGIEPDQLIRLGTIRYQRSSKTVTAYAGRAPKGSQARCCSWEVDHAEFFPLSQAYEIIHPDQRDFLDRLVAHLHLNP